MSRLEDWVEQQAKTITGKSKVQLFRLRGPDQSTWGTWPADSEEVAAAIQQCMVMLGEELPKGRHPVTVWAFDETGAEVAMLPQAVHGASDAATATGAGEALTLQKATSAAIMNANSLNEGLRRQCEHLNTALAETTQSNIELIETVQKLVAQNAEREMAESRREALNTTVHVVAEALQAHAPQLIGMLLGKLGTQEDESKPDDGPPKLEGPPAPAPTPQPEPPNPPVKVKTDARKPSDRADHHSTRKPQGAKARGPRGSAAERRDASTRARKSSSRRTSVRKPVRRSARNP